MMRLKQCAAQLGVRGGWVHPSLGVVVHGAVLRARCSAAHSSTLQRWRRSCSDRGLADDWQPSPSCPIYRWTARIETRASPSTAAEASSVKCWMSAVMPSPRGTRRTRQWLARRSNANLWPRRRPFKGCQFASQTARSPSKMLATAPRSPKGYTSGTGEAACRCL